MTIAPRICVVCFDLDGTLLPGTSVSLELARALGQFELLQDLEAKFRRGEIANAQIAEASAAAFAGISLAQVEAILAQIPLIGGVASTVAALKASGAHLLLSTVTWRFAARFYQRRLGFDEASGTEMSETDGILGGVVTRHCAPTDKRDFVRKYCALHGVDMSQCAAVGDSLSDVPLFKTVGLAVALNGTPEAVAAARFALTTEDLTDLLPILAAGVGKNEFDRLSESSLRDGPSGLT